MPTADLTPEWIDGLLSEQCSNGVAAAVSVWTPAGSVVRWTSPDRSAYPAHPGQEPAFLAYSITKTFIACLLLQLADAGRLDLDAPVNSLWQGPPLPAAFTDVVTTRRLLNHTAGVPDYGGQAGYHEQVRQNPGQPWSTGQFTQATLATPWAVPQPPRFSYSNPGYMVLRQLLDMVGDQPWQVQLDERICQPLGLRHTHVADTLADLLPLAPGLSRLITEGDAPVDVRGRYHPGWVSHGVLASTASDITAFLHALFTGTLLQPGSLAAMVSAVPVEGAGGHWRQARYGLGLMTDPAAEPGQVRGHNGGGPGYSASAFAVWREGTLRGVATSMVGGGRPDDAEAITFKALAQL